MKKKFVLASLMFVIGMCIMPNVLAAEDEAKVDGELSSFTEALNKVKSKGGTIELQHEVVLESMVDLSVDNPVTINMNGFNISSSAVATNFIIRKGEVKFTGSGKIQNSYPRNLAGTLYVKGSNNISDKNYTHLIIDKDVVVEGYNPLFIDSYSVGVPHCYGATVDIYGSIIDKSTTVGSSYALGVDAKLKDYDNAPVINIHDGAVVRSELPTGLGIYLFGYANVNIYKALVEGHTGIFAAAGSIHLEGATIKATGEEDLKEKYGRGTGGTGAAIQIESNDSRAGNVSIDIDGGSYTSKYNSAIVEYSNGATETSVKEIHISDGEFKSAEGYDTIDTSDSFKDNNKEFITGGNFLVGDEKYDVVQYMKSGLLQNEDGTVINPTSVKPNKEEHNNILNPDTSDINLLMLISLITLSGLGLGYTIKKRRFN